MPIRHFRELIAWQLADAFETEVTHLVLKSATASRDFKYRSELLDALTGVPANIAEGFKKRGRADKVRFLNIAQGSLEECRYYLILAKDLNYGDTTPLKSQLEEVSKLLEAYAAKILASGF